MITSLLEILNCCRLHRMFSTCNTLKTRFLKHTGCLFISLKDGVGVCVVSV